MSMVLPRSSSRKLVNMTAEASHDLVSIGQVVDTVDVTIGPRFLELFSGHLYASPNKAFEELISNSWDAGATVVHVGIPDDLHDPGAPVWVLDNGESMDVDGFKVLWSVAASTKPAEDPTSKRQQIGKFGIGKLATYVLANQLTYVCRTSDGMVRAITMDYRVIQDAEPHRLDISPITLDVRAIADEELSEILTGLTDGDSIRSLIEAGVPPPEGLTDYEDEFRHPDASGPEPSGSWTLALLTSLKDTGRRMQSGHIRRMLRYSLPLGNSMSIVFNGEPLVPTKADIEVASEWVIGPGLGITAVPAPDGSSLVITEFEDPYHHVRIDSIDGPITGTVRLYKDRISGGKSEELGFSNGFFINVKGRVINLQDPYFGLSNLSHSAWARFRATVRADWLDSILAVNREDLLERPELQAFREFLLSLFNKARSAYDAAVRAAWPGAGEILTEAWGTVPLDPLRDVVSESLSNPATAPSFVDLTGVDDPERALSEWQESSKQDPGAILSDIEFEARSLDEPLVRYDVGKRTVYVNQNHPFAREHAETHEEQLTLRDVALVEFLTDAKMVALGLSDDQVAEIRDYRDQTYRLIARVRRRTGAQIAELLIATTAESKPFEEAVGDALEYLGFLVNRQGQTGKPEGVATAPLTADEDAEGRSYSFTYDAKSSASGKVKTGDVNPGRLARHRDDFNAEHCLVVAPEFEEGALEKECSHNGVTPMRAHDLARLLILVATYGPFDLEAFRRVFELHSPESVATWADSRVADAQKLRKLSLGSLFQAMENVGFEAADTLTTSVLAHEMRALEKDDEYPTARDVGRAVYGLSVMVPSLVRTSGEKVVLGASPQKIRDAVRGQISGIPEEYRLGFGEDILEQDESE